MGLAKRERLMFIQSDKDGRQMLAAGFKQKPFRKDAQVRGRAQDLGR